ncbi:MAG TPA: VWA domain-containing protein [Jatrophihabitans sp.]
MSRWSRRTRTVAIGTAAAVLTGLLVVAGPTGAGAEGAPAGPASSLCEPGQPGVIYGTAGNDKLSGTSGDDVICGLGGNDSLDGRGGNDIVDGGDGADQLSSGTGNDQAFGGAGNDVIDGADGDDSLYGEDGTDTLTGGAGNDSLDGGAGNDKLTASDGNDRMRGGPGEDDLSAGAGDDTLDGGPDTDVLDAAAGTDVCLNGENNTGCEQGKEVLDPLGNPLVIATPQAGPLTFTIDDSFPGVSLTVDSAGGIYPWDVEISPARAYMQGILPVLAGPAFDIRVPSDAKKINGATLTLPYSESRLQVPASDARIWTFDPERQFWIPVPGAQQVDPVKHTVTAHLEHFSVYAVLGVNDSWGWEQVFKKTPLRCTGGPPGGNGGFDVVFVIDTSGSMSWNDPSGLRVDGAAAFVDAMGANDRAAVVTFDNFATTDIGLTSTGTSGGISAIKAALERGRDANGGTDIGAGVRSATQLLANNGGGSRARIAVLLTDGVSSYDPALTTAAANNAVEIHTVGLGSDTDTTLLQSIASGTGGSYRGITDPAQLPELYRQLAGDIIGGDLDTDGDKISDCVERNGAFTPLTGLIQLFLPTASDFITTDPNNADSDGDTLQDGYELVATPLRDDPVLAQNYDFLVDQGLTTYYKMVADPTKKDTDGDGLDDNLELLNRTDPLSSDDSDLDIDGLDLPPFTLFQPSRYSQKPVISQRLDVQKQADGTSLLVRHYYNANPVTYDEDRDCVENCDAVRQLAQDRPDDNGFGVCVFGVGDCVDDTSQERDVVEEAREKQGVFDDDDGDLSEDFLRLQTALECAIWTADAKACFDAAAQLDLDDKNADEFGEVLASAVIAVPVAGPGVAANPELMRRIARVLITLGVVSAAAVTVEQLVEAVRNCFESPVLRVIKLALPFVHPCEWLPMFSPAGDVKTAAEHKVAAIRDQPLRMALTYSTAAEVRARGVARGWYVGKPGCTAADQAAAQQNYGVAVACDEFPYYSTTTSGPGASLKYIPSSDNSLEGTRLNVFYRACPRVSAPVPANRDHFLVVPIPVLPVTVAHCGRALS